MKNNKDNIKKIYSTVSSAVKKNPNRVVSNILKKRDEIQREIDKMKDGKSKKLCQNALNALSYAKKTDAVVSEGIGSFFKKHLFKIIMCVIVLALFLPGLIFGAIGGATMCGARDIDTGGTGIFGAVAGGLTGGILGALASPFIVIQGIIQKISGSDNVINTLSNSKIIDVPSDIPTGVESISSGGKTYIPGHYEGNNFIKGYYK